MLIEDVEEKNTLQGFTILATIVDEIARVEANFVKFTEA